MVHFHFSGCKNATIFDIWHLRKIAVIVFTSFDRCHSSWHVPWFQHWTASVWMGGALELLEPCESTKQRTAFVAVSSATNRERERERERGVDGSSAWRITPPPRLRRWKSCPSLPPYSAHFVYQGTRAPYTSKHSLSIQPLKTGDILNGFASAPV